MSWSVSVSVCWGEEPIDMTGNGSDTSTRGVEIEFFLSPVIDRRTDPKFEKEVRGVFEIPLG